MEDENEGFEVVDKRRLRDESSTSNIPADSNDDAKQSEQMSQVAEDELSPDKSTEESVNVVSILVYMLTLLANSAYQWMGLIVNPSTGKPEKDMEQVQLAIDTFAFISDKIAPHIDSQLQKEIQNSLSDLRVNYVEKIRTPDGAN